jgi:hypothetical protein
VAQGVSKLTTLPLLNYFCHFGSIPFILLQDSVRSSLSNPLKHTPKYSLIMSHHYERVKFSRFFRDQSRVGDKTDVKLARSITTTTRTRILTLTVT